MSGKYSRSSNSRKHNPFFASPLATVLTCMLAFLAVGLFIKCGVDLVDKIPDRPDVSISSTTTGTEETTEPGPLRVVSTATISSQGDLLMHKPVIQTCVDSEGNYDFSSIFRYVKDYIAGYDYAVANLETTLGGPNYPYQGNPNFNTPDAFADDLAETGYDMMLTANNHSADTTASGILRTLEQLRSRNLATVGTQKDETEQDYIVIEINGIRLGIGCYTYATGENDGKPSLNYNSTLTKAGIVNYYLENKLDRFYGEVEAQINGMKQQGVDAIFFYMHWGVEYETVENEMQNKIAQKLCDLGVDVIIGGHPHVVQPMELMQSTRDPSHRTICIYSLGNVVSNQREGIDASFKGGFTEDGAIFTVTLEKYSDGTVAIASVDVLPTWVNMHTTNGVKEYNVLPLDLRTKDQWQELYGISESTAQKAMASYNRTMNIVCDGLEECQKLLDTSRSVRLGEYE